MEREIVPIADELAADVAAGRAERYRQFIAQWELEDMPACDRGMILLMDLADAHPIAYEMARKQGFGNLTHPIFQKLPRWIVFAEHYNSCPNCNESDPKLRPDDDGAYWSPAP